MKVNELKIDRNVIGGDEFMCRRIIWTVLLVFVFAIPSMAYSADMDMKSIAEKEIEKVSENGKVIIEYVPMDEVDVVPGDIVRFTNVYKNISNKTIEPGVTIRNPVPGDVIYIEGSAVGADSRITFSVDNGQTFKVPAELIVLDKDGTGRIARPEEYTDIRWVLMKPVRPGESGRVSYRGKLK